MADGTPRRPRLRRFDCHVRHPQQRQVRYRRIAAPQQQVTQYVVGLGAAPPLDIAQHRCGHQ